jgi:propionyl-CoA carboxylase alpha chain
VDRLLVANRGEIARRVFATCRAQGIETVAVHSDADAHALHVTEADYAVHLTGNSAADTYLRADLTVEAARRAGADAVHPGYGFLSENADFAARVLDAGLTWVGPPPEAIAAMGSKLGAKELVAKAGVPTLPLWTAAEQVTAFPVLVKASAGGGGRGMRVVRAAGELPEALAAASREAEAAFGEGTVFCERYVERSRHVEVQVLADSHGTVLALGERECSIQRRHQKIVEESPSPAVTPALRAALSEAACEAARTVGYIGAGTVEFLLTPEGEFFFLEMNTRLQVEHPVTECVYGVDLVALQLLVAEGAPLPFTETPPMRGHAIEVRLYAEDPAAGWLPATGTLHAFDVPHDTAFAVPAGAGIRLDSGFGNGDSVTPHYDPMLAKVIAWAPSRAAAARSLASALARARLHGVTTNRDLLVRTLRSPSFASGDTSTAFLDEHPEVFAPLVDSTDARYRAALAAALAAAAERRATAPVLRHAPSGWRNVGTELQEARFRAGDDEIVVRYRFARDATVTHAGECPDVVAVAADRVTLDVAGVRLDYAVHRVGSRSFVDSPEGSLTLTEVERFPLPVPVLAAGSLIAPLPGSVGRVLVVEGATVQAGDLLLTLEAMKLEHPVLAPSAGVVTALPVAPGTQVDTGAVLAVITAPPQEA